MAITAAHETSCASTTLDPGLTGRLVHHRGAKIIVTKGAFHYGRAQCHVKKEAAIVVTTKFSAISPTIAAIEDWKSASEKHHVKATAVTSAKPHAISRSRGASKSLDTA